MHSLHTIHILDPQEFSTNLKEMSDPPKKLFLRGNLSFFKELMHDPDCVWITIIGARTHTSYGERVVSKILRELSAYNVCIVSGLAVGIDSLVHINSLKHNLPTVAVPGSGLDDSVIYPRSNFDLAQSILTSKNILLSEYEPFAKTQKYFFPARNRIMAGLSHATIIIEGEKDSGTLITARLALDYNRSVMAVPGEITSLCSEGPLSLIQEGAEMICRTEDIVKSLGLKKRPISTEYASITVSAADSASPFGQSTSLLSDTRGATSGHLPTPSSNHIMIENEAACLILELLKKETIIQIASIAQKINKSGIEISIALSVLELKNIIKKECHVY